MALLAFVCYVSRMPLLAIVLSAATSTPAATLLEVSGHDELTALRGAAVRELRVRLPEFEIRVAGPNGPEGRPYRLVLSRKGESRDQGYGWLDVSLSSPQQLVLLSHALLQTDSDRDARKIAVLVEGAVRLHLKELGRAVDAMMVESDPVRFMTAVGVGTTFLPGLSHVSPVAALALMADLWKMRLRLEVSSNLTRAVGSGPADLRLSESVMSIRGGIGAEWDGLRMAFEVGPSGHLIWSRVGAENARVRSHTGVYGGLQAAASVLQRVSESWLIELLLTGEYLPVSPTYQWDGVSLFDRGHVRIQATVGMAFGY